MNKFLKVTLIMVALICLVGPVSAATYTLTVRADSTIAGHPGKVLSETFEEDGFVELSEVMAFVENEMYRIYGFRDGGEGSWDILPGSFYLCPTSSMTIGQSWVGLPGDNFEPTIYTVGALETVTVPAGTFPNAYRVDHRHASQAPDSQPFESQWYVYNVGFIKTESYYSHGAVDYFSELTDYTLSGTGFMPVDVGNTWVYNEDANFSPVGEQDVPGQANLIGAYPNPFNPSTQLAFELNEAGPVRLSIYDAAGRLITTLFDEHRTSGRHEVTWNGRDQAGRMSPAGVYLYRLEQGNFSETKRMTLVK